jgi:hypothetical protein
MRAAVRAAVAGERPPKERRGSRRSVCASGRGGPNLHFEPLLDPVSRAVTFPPAAIFGSSILVTYHVEHVLVLWNE